MNQQEKLHTTGSGNEKELIYRIYGREIAGSVIPVDAQNGSVRLRGFLGRPEYSRSTRAYEIFFVNGRVLKSDILSKGLEEGYRTDLLLPIRRKLTSMCIPLKWKSAFPMPEPSMIS